MGNWFAKKEFKKKFHLKFSDFLSTSTEGFLILWKKSCLLDRSTVINTQVAHFIRWSLRLKNQLDINELIQGFAGVGIISEDYLYEVTMNGFIKTQSFKRIKELHREGYIIAVQK